VPGSVSTEEAAADARACSPLGDCLHYGAAAGYLASSCPSSRLMSTIPCFPYWRTDSRMSAMIWSADLSRSIRCR
jgi:hypothetical protein